MTKDFFEALPHKTSLFLYNNKNILKPRTIDPIIRTAVCLVIYTNSRSSSSSSSSSSSRVVVVVGGGGGGGVQCLLLMRIRS